MTMAWGSNTCNSYPSGCRCLDCRERDALAWGVKLEAPEAKPFWRSFLAGLSAIFTAVPREGPPRAPVSLLDGDFAEIERRILATLALKSARTIFPSPGETDWRLWQWFGVTPVVGARYRTEAGEDHRICGVMHVTPKEGKPYCLYKTVPATPPSLSSASVSFGFDPPLHVNDVVSTAVSAGKGKWYFEATVNPGTRPFEMKPPAGFAPWDVQDEQLGREAYELDARACRSFVDQEIGDDYPADRHYYPLPTKFETFYNCTSQAHAVKRARDWRLWMERGAKVRPVSPFKPNLRNQGPDFPGTYCQDRSWHRLNYDTLLNKFLDEEVGHG